MGVVADSRVLSRLCHCNGELDCSQRAVPGGRQVTRTGARCRRVRSQRGLGYHSWIGVILPRVVSGGLALRQQVAHRRAPGHPFEGPTEPVPEYQRTRNAAWRSADGPQRPASRAATICCSQPANSSMVVPRSVGKLRCASPRPSCTRSREECAGAISKDDAAKSLLATPHHFFIRSAQSMAATGRNLC